MFLRCCFWVGLVMSMAPMSSAQAAGIQLRAVLLPTAQVRPERIPVMLEVGDLTQSNSASAVNFDLVVRWNLLPSARRVDVAASFEREDCALKDADGHCLEISDLEFWPESGKSASRSGNEFLLLNEIVSPANRVGSLVGRYRITVRPKLTTVPGRFRGWLLLRAWWH
jgi:hypothetical protein